MLQFTFSVEVSSMQDATVFAALHPGASLAGMFLAALLSSSCRVAYLQYHQAKQFKHHLTWMQEAMLQHERT
jgi:hypothetical protein